jgi:hypothetical protein
MDLVEDDQGEDLPDARYRAQAIESVGIVLLAGGVLDVGEEFGPLVHEVHPTSQ